MYSEPRYLPGGDRALIVEFADEISEEVSQMVRRFSLALARYPLPGVLETVPTYRSLVVYFDPLAMEGPRLVEKLKGLQKRILEIDLPPARTVLVPVLYGSEYGPDLGDVASHNGLTPEEVIAIHASSTYLIYMLGFTPGFAYLGGLSPRIVCPRLDNPREQIPGGSVGIAGIQTGIYPIDSPGGWRIIGRTPLRLYDPDVDPPALFQAGDYLKFSPIDEEGFYRIAEGGRSR
ncbi:MAG: 5-oxoprolinase subunit PxpB [Firmicutes bacterium]|nr:5-oxoprolinase subunit PxpB [Bacillota bacterium]